MEVAGSYNDHGYDKYEYDQAAVTFIKNYMKDK